jgi:diadenosine tetraphosphate (Ap4A) HIT family hydrolase
VSLKSPLGAFWAKFRVAELLVSESAYWTWSIRPAQATLGAGIIALKRHASRFADVSREEMSDLADLVTRVEQRTADRFRHRIMNYLMLMMVDHHVHFHVLPRYESPRQFAGRVWQDPGWPGLPVLGDAQHADVPELLIEIRRALIET